VKPSSTLDVSHLPTVAFGSRDPLWWGGVGLLIIEAVFLAIGMVSYFYLRALTPVWPPPPTARPDLLMPTVNMLLLLVSVVPMWWVDRAARRLERRAVRIGLVLCVILGLVFSGLRVFEFHALHTRWNSHAYGSVVWTLLGLHTFDWVALLVEIIVVMIQAFMGPMTQYRFLDISDSAPFWYFIVAIWLPIYAVLYVVPRIL
jgi:cytochrome c oxidase subunit III